METRVQISERERKIGRDQKEVPITVRERKLGRERRPPVNIKDPNKKD